MKCFNGLFPTKNSTIPLMFPKKYAADIELANWVNSNQREQNEVMSEYRVNLLGSIGFVWNQQDNQWDKMFQKLVAYKKTAPRINFSSSTA